MTKTQHQATVQPDEDIFHGSCPCGWVGPMGYGIVGAAYEDAEQHVDMEERMAMMTPAQREAVTRVAEEFGDFLYSHSATDGAPAGSTRYVFRDRTFLSMAEVRAEAALLRMGDR